MIHKLSGRPHALWAAGLLMLALLLSQTLGLWHSVVHGPIHGASGGWAAQVFSGHGAQGVHQDHGVKEVQGSTDDTPQCRLYDQCSHGDALIQLPALAPPLALTPLVLSVLAGLARARWQAYFQARGPPRVR
jgi:hypothetical protein